MDIHIKLLNLMLKGIKTINFNNKTYKLLGRGGESNVYSFDDFAVKVYKSDLDISHISYEIYVIDSIRSDPRIESHVVNIFNCNSNTEYDSPISYCFMELYDGDLDRWVMDSLYNLYKDDIVWLSMIFQVVYTMDIINSLNVLHNDSKPKNIFYKKQKLSNQTYEWHNKIFEVPIECRFVVGDFGHSLVPDLKELYLPGSTGTGDLMYDLSNRSDLFELSRILYRARVNVVLKSYTEAEIKDMISNIQDQKFQSRLKCVDKDIKSKFSSNPPNININKIMNRAHVYELIEFGYIKDSELESKANVLFPSLQVQNTLQDIMNLDKNLPSLFEVFYKP